ncbi:MAG TPA: hypothetical protein VFC19_15920 [Candidatus Limnocylindrales bacterium]|nr:hypothetical protein [Candidatus Limnocylindrales bacterium]
MAFTGQAPPVVLTDIDGTDIDGTDIDDDPTVTRSRFTAPDPGDPGPPRVSWDTRLGRGALITVLILAAMLPVALALAAAAR